MENTLFLTTGEQETFQGLSNDLKDGWNIELQDVYTYEDADELFLRYQIASIDDPTCVALASSIQSAGSDENILTQLDAVDFSTFSQEQLAEVFFVLGTHVAELLLRHLLSTISDDEDIESVAALSIIRRMLIESNSPENT